MAETEHNLEILFDRSTSTDRPLLLKAKEDLKRKVKDDPSAANLAALSRVTKMLDEAMSSQNGNVIFLKVADVLAYLQKAGRKVSQAQIYKDLKRGYLRRQPDRSFRQRDVDNYASTLAIISMPEAKTDGVMDLAEEKLREEVGKIREQRQTIAFDREIKAGKYVRKEDVYLELAARAVTLKSGLKTIFEARSLEIIDLCEGNPKKSVELVDFLNGLLDAALHEYSREMELAVEFDESIRNGIKQEGSSEDGEK